MSGSNGRIGGKQKRGNGSGERGKSTKWKKRETFLKFILPGHSPQLHESVVHKSHALVIRQKSYY